MIHIVLGLGMGLVSALAINWSFFVQHGAANDVGTLSLRRPLAALRVLVANPRWLLGYCAGWIGWIVYIAALRFAPLSLVQASCRSLVARGDRSRSRWPASRSLERRWRAAYR
jgi:hypothetical protein